MADYKAVNRTVYKQKNTNKVLRAVETNRSILGGLLSTTSLVKAFHFTHKFKPLSFMRNTLVNLANKSSKGVIGSEANMIRAAIVMKIDKKKKEARLEKQAEQDAAAIESAQLEKEQRIQDKSNFIGLRNKKTDIKQDDFNDALLRMKNMPQANREAIADGNDAQEINFILFARHFETIEQGLIDSLNAKNNSPIAAMLRKFALQGSFNIRELTTEIENQIQDKENLTLFKNAALEKVAQFKNAGTEQSVESVYDIEFEEVADLDADKEESQNARFPIQMQPTFNLATFKYLLDQFDEAAELDEDPNAKMNKKFTPRLEIRQLWETLDQHEGTRFSEFMIEHRQMSYTLALIEDPALIPLDFEMDEPLFEAMLASYEQDTFDWAELTQLAQEQNKYRNDLIKNSELKTNFKNSNWNDFVQAINDNLALADQNPAYYDQTLASVKEIENDMGESLHLQSRLMMITPLIANGINTALKKMTSPGMEVPNEMTARLYNGMRENQIDVIELLDDAEKVLAINVIQQIPALMEITQKPIWSSDEFEDLLAWQNSTSTHQDEKELYFSQIEKFEEENPKQNKGFSSFYMHGNEISDTWSYIKDCQENPEGFSDSELFDPNNMDELGLALLEASYTGVYDLAKITEAALASKLALATATIEKPKEVAVEDKQELSKQYLNNTADLIATQKVVFGQNSENAFATDVLNTKKPIRTFNVVFN